MKKRLIKATTLLTTLSLLSACSGDNKKAQAAQEDGVVVTIGDENITEEAFNEEMKKAVGDVTLRSIVLEKSLEKKVEDPEKYRKEAEELVKEQIEKAGGQEAFEQFLAYQNRGSIEEFQHQIYVQNMLQDVLEGYVDVSDDKLKNYYDNSYEPKMEAQHILVEDEKLAKDLIKQLDEGADFDELAREHSTDTTAENGGLLSPFTKGQMVKEFEDAVRSLKNGEYTKEPVESQFGFHVIKTIKNGEKEPFEDVKEDIEREYIDSRLQDSDFTFGVVARVIKEAGVEIKDESLKGALDELLSYADKPLEKEESKEESKEEKEDEATEEAEGEGEEETEEESTEE